MVKRLLFILIPIVVAILVFMSISLFLAKSQTGLGALQVTSSPISNVYLNGKLLGKTPLCDCEGKNMIPSGSYVVRLEPLAGDNLLPYEEHITIAKGILTVVDRTFGLGEFSSGSVVTLVPVDNKNAVQLFVTSFPSGASISLDGNTSGTTPLLLKSVTQSDHELQLSKNGYKDETVHIHTVAGYQLNTLITLSLTTPDASISAAPTPSPSVTTVTILDTPTGFLRVRKEPSLVASETAQVNPGQVLPYEDEQDGWYEIQLPDGTSGWVSTQYATKSN